MTIPTEKYVIDDNGIYRLKSIDTSYKGRDHVVHSSSIVSVEEVMSKAAFIEAFQKYLGLKNISEN